MQPEHFQPDFSVVTACLNSAATIRDNVNSVHSQEKVTVEHIIKDGGSSDATIEIARHANAAARIVSRPDQGVYDAMNQGFREATGKFVAFLNSDDYYAHPRVLSKVLETFNRRRCDIVFGDICMIDKLGNTRRMWRGRELRDGLLDGMQLPHPGLFIRHSVLSQLDQPFDASYTISADLKQQLLLIEKCLHSTAHLADQVACMRIGGESTKSLRAVTNGWLESARAYREVHGKNGARFVLKKVLLKIKQIRWSIDSP